MKLMIEKEVRAREGAAIRDELHNMLVRLKDRSSSIHSLTEENAATLKLPSATEDNKSGPSKAKAAAPTQKAVAKRDEYEQRKLLREKVPETNFMLADLPWSQWSLVTDVDKEAKSKGVQGSSYTGSVYELSVQTRSRARRYPVYYTTHVYMTVYVT